MSFIEKSMLNLFKHVALNYKIHLQPVVALQLFSEQ